ncbi:MAG: hypothetical protein ACP5D0_01960 [Hydrogenovibrio sp.]
MSKVILVILLIGFMALAIMFDWFDGRDLAQTALNALQKGVIALEETGDAVTGAVEQVQQQQKEAP